MSTIEHRISLIDDLLAEQGRLGTAVGRFSKWHGDTGGAPSPESRYRELVPLTRPAPGGQFAFEVNLDQCTGCKACVTACHSLNGLDDDESWRDVGLLLGAGDEPFVQTVTSACHHCADPACANGCPVLAYEKDPETGIVRHLDDQCIGCSYCIMKCPYDVPKYNAKRGIVRKCDMCHQRLSVGEAPACVQACPNGAIAIRIVEVDDAIGRALKPGARLVPGVAKSDYTLPTTRYVSTRPLPQSALAADAERLRVEAAHTPLVVMLVLTQLATGAFLFSQTAVQNGIGTVAMVVGLAASVAHLGQPLKAWRAFLGWRKSWLSREILAFAAFAPACLAASLGLVPACAAAVAGLAGVFCSVMVYVDTRRPFWSLTRTLIGFLGTTLLLGGALAVATGAGAGRVGFCPTVSLFALLRLAYEGFLIVRLPGGLRKSARLMRGPLGDISISRFVLGAAGALILPMIPPAGFVLLLAGEFAGRVLFFRAVVAGRMPGHA